MQELALGTDMPHKSRKPTVRLSHKEARKVRKVLREFMRIHGRPYRLDKLVLDHLMSKKLLSRVITTNHVAFQRHKMGKKLDGTRPRQRREVRVKADGFNFQQVIPYNKIASRYVTLTGVLVKLSTALCRSIKEERVELLIDHEHEAIRLKPTNNEERSFKLASSEKGHGGRSFAARALDTWPRGRYLEVSDNSLIFTKRNEKHGS